MTPGRMALMALAGLTASLSGIAGLITLVLAVMGFVAWLWPIVCAVVFVAAMLTAVFTFVKIIANLDESFEPNGILGKFIEKMETKF